MSRGRKRRDPCEGMDIPGSPLGRGQGTIIYTTCSDPHKQAQKLVQLVFLGSLFGAALLFLSPKLLQRPIKGWAPLLCEQISPVPSSSLCVHRAVLWLQTP
jgi:hypothetical protein